MAISEFKISGVRGVTVQTPPSTPSRGGPLIQLSFRLYIFSVMANPFALISTVANIIYTYMCITGKITVGVGDSYI